MKTESILKFTRAKFGDKGWIAMNIDKEWYWYEKKPTRDNTYFYVWNTRAFLVCTQGEHPNWKESLVKL